MQSRSSRNIVNADGNGDDLEYPDDHRTRLSVGLEKGATAIDDNNEEYGNYGVICEAKGDNDIHFSESSTIERRPPSRHKGETLDSGGGGGLTSRSRDGKVGVATSSNFQANGQPSLDTTSLGSGECVSEL